MTTCTKHDGCRATPADVLRWMRAEAIEFDHDEWLDDEQHPVWEWAITAAARVSP